MSPGTRARADPPIDAVVFDLDGLLLDSERLYLDSFDRTRETLGFAIPHDAYFRLVGLNMRDLRSMLKGLLRTDSSADAFLHEWNREIAALFEFPIPLKPGALEICEHLQGMGMSLAVATGSNVQRASDRIEKAGLLGYFAVIVGGDQVACGKPAPDIYLEAARQLGAAPTQTAAFEDSDVGVQAALAAGMVTVQVPDLIQPAAAVRRLGHIIAPDIVSGAESIGLI